MNLRKFLLALSVLFTPFTFAKSRLRSRGRRPQSISAQALPDYRAREIFRRRAPFLVEARGNAVRINKDGTFTRDADAREYAPDGKWKILNNHVKLRWNNGEEYDYPVAFAGSSPVIAGHRANRRGTFEIDLNQQ